MNGFFNKNINDNSVVLQAKLFVHEQLQTELMPASFESLGLS